MTKRPAQHDISDILKSNEQDAEADALEGKIDTPEQIAQRRIIKVGGAKKSTADSKPAKLIINAKPPSFTVPKPEQKPAEEKNPKASVNSPAEPSNEPSNEVQEILEKLKNSSEVPEKLQTIDTKPEAPQTPPKLVTQRSLFLDEKEPESKPKLSLLFPPSLLQRTQTPQEMLRSPQVFKTKVADTTKMPTLSLFRE